MNSSSSALISWQIPFYVNDEIEKDELELSLVGFTYKVKFSTQYPIWIYKEVVFTTDYPAQIRFPLTIGEHSYNQTSKLAPQPAWN